jgi:hypothetical protein
MARVDAYEEGADGVALMVGSLYDALRSANVEEEKARKAAEDVADFDKRANDLGSAVARLEQKMDGRFTLLQWMLGFNLAFTLALLFKVFS